MTDFLTRLVERTLNLTPVVQPVVAPMFSPEPAQRSPLGIMEPARRDDVAGVRDPRSGERPALLSQTERRPTIPLRQEGHLDVTRKPFVHETVAHAAAPEQDRAFFPGIVDVTLTRRVAREAGRKVYGTESPPTGPLDYLSTGRSMEEKGEKASVDSSFKGLTKEGSMENVINDRVPLPRKDDEFSSVRPVARADELTPAEPLKKKGAEPLIVRPQLARPSVPRREGETERGRYRPAESLARSTIQGPTIRVTIGRIDVRAVMAQPPQPERARTPAPGLSLSDYLQSRDGGKR